MCRCPLSRTYPWPHLFVLNQRLLVCTNTARLPPSPVSRHIQTSPSHHCHNSQYKFKDSLKLLVMGKKAKAIELDGRTGEGGGQLVRIACALAAVTSQPVRIHHVRGNREGPRGGGLKAQHLSAIEWLARATEAETEGVEIRSKSFELRPTLPPTALRQRNIKIVADTPAASAMLIFQAAFPFLLFAGTEDGEPIELEIRGGTNVSWSLSYEYLDQVLLPTLQDRFDIHVERKLLKRGWATGSQSQGSVWFKFTPIRPEETLKPRVPPSIVAEQNSTTSLPARRNLLSSINRIDVSLIVPSNTSSALQNAISADLDTLFPDAAVHFVVNENSGHEARMYILLVAHSSTTSLRWGRDYGTSDRGFLYSNKTRKKMTTEQLCTGISKSVCKDLYEELEKGGVDEFLQDQLVVFQALAEGRTSFPRDEEGFEDDEAVRDVIEDLGNVTLSSDQARMRKDKTHEPFGQGSTHTTTARWVASELIPQAQWYNKGSICEGAGIRIAPEGNSET